MVEVLYFSDAQVKAKLLERVARAARPLLVVQVRHDPKGHPPDAREPFVTLERRFGDVLDVVVVADEGTHEGMWRDPVGDLADTLFPEDRHAAYGAASGYLLLERGKPLVVVKKRGAHADDLWFLQEAFAAHLAGVPPPDPAARPGRRSAKAGPRASGGGPRRVVEEEPRRTPASFAAPPEDPWRVLGVARGTPLPEAKRAYRALVSQYHPDKVSHLAPEFQELAQRRTLQILDAWRRIEEGEA